MNKIVGTLLIISCYLSGSAQDQGIQFVKGISWEQIQEKAKKEHKFIFMDCYTTWCGPCKYMVKNIFPLKETGDAVNPDFISISVQLDTSKFDSEMTKLWYADAHLIATKYKVNTYPTYLFFDQMGNLVHRAVGATQDAGQFTNYTKDARNPDKQYYSMIDKYRNGSADTILLENLIHQSLTNGDALLADSVLKTWFRYIKNPYTRDRLEMIAPITKKSSDPGFDLFYHNATKIDQIENPDFAESVVMYIIFRENKAIARLFSNSSAIPDWSLIGHEITKQYSDDYAHRILTWVKVPYYKMKKQYDKYAVSLITYLKEFGDLVDDPTMNNYCWDIFEYCTKPEDLAFGISSIERTLKPGNKMNLPFIAGWTDTYANLLYKSGQKEKAIIQESKALELIDAAQRPAYQATLDKMKKGQKTWD